jgi:nicotinamide-nucleotide amidase
MNEKSETVEAALGALLTKNGLTVATAESCSGGLIAHRITNVAGSSGYFLGGIVSYSNEAKSGLLRVDEDALLECGAVSEEVAAQMAEGVRENFGADLAVAVTGIAGPGGGSDEKPVGLVYVAVSDADGVYGERCEFLGTREEIKEQTADKALELLMEKAR